MYRSNPIIGIVLASGRGQRFDKAGRENKLIARTPNGDSVLATSVRTMGTVLASVIVTVRPDDHEVMNSLRGLNCEVLACPEAMAGMGSAIAAGVSHVVARCPHASGCLIALGDMPCVMPNSVADLVDALADNEMVAPEYRGRRGHPVGFSRRHFESLMRLHGDQGAKNLLEAAGNRLHRVQVNDAGVVFDIDYPEDLEKLYAMQKINP